MADLNAQLPPPAALQALLQRLNPVDSESVPWTSAAGRALAAPLLADRPSPACDVSAMDGYALRLTDFEQLARQGLPISAATCTGQQAPELKAGTAVKVMTGGMVPPQADAIIRREDLEESNQRIGLRSGVERPEPGQDIRRRGENLRQHEQVLASGTLITSAAVGALSCFGQAAVSVYRKLRIATLVTGDELRAPEDKPLDWQVRDCNGPALRGVISRCALLEHTLARQVPDRREALQSALHAALTYCDAIILTGGVSAGDFDYVPAVVQDAGAQIVFHRLPIRPGKPVLAAVGPQGQLILGLPGNPVSVLVTLHRFGMPALLKRAGVCQPTPRVPAVMLSEPVEPAKLWVYKLATLGPDGRACLVKSRGSGDLVSSARADGFVEIPAGQSGSGPWPFYAWI